MNNFDQSSTGLNITVSESLQSLYTSTLESIEKIYIEEITIHQANLEGK